MTTPSVRDEHLRTLERLFRRKPVARLNEMQRALGTSNRTVFRALSRLDYLSSYSHAGQYYTLRRIPTFDAHGLWFHGETRFSVQGTLRATVVVLIKQAPAGRTHEELQALVGLRLHDTLRSLVESKALGREPVAGTYIYLHPSAPVAATQLARRGHGAQLAAPPRLEGPLDFARVVDILVAVIHAPKADARAIAAQLRSRGLDLTEEQVAGVFARYGLKKTPPSRSRPSRR